MIHAFPQSSITRHTNALTTIFLLAARIQITATEYLVSNRVEFHSLRWNETPLLIGEIVRVDAADHALFRLPETQTRDT